MKQIFFTLYSIIIAKVRLYFYSRNCWKNIFRFRCICYNLPCTRIRVILDCANLCANFSKHTARYYRALCDSTRLYGNGGNDHSLYTSSMIIAPPRFRFMRVTRTVRRGAELRITMRASYTLQISIE